MQSNFELAESIFACIILNSILFYILSSIRIKAKTIAGLIKVYVITWLVFFGSLCILTIISISIRFQHAYLITSLIIAIFYMLIKLFLWLKSDYNKKGMAAFFIYLAIILYITIFFRIGSDINWVKLDLLYAIKRLFVEDSIAEIKHLLLNVILFVPLGFTLPMINPNILAKYRYFITGVLISTCIESTQLLFAKGECDVADVFGNGLGMLIGIWTYKLIHKKM